MFFGAIVLSTMSYAQEKSTTETKPKRITVVKAGEPMKKGTAEKGKEALTPAQELERCKAHLVALDKKEEYLRSDAKRWEEALESGWLKDANKTRATLNQQIQELKKKLG